MLQLKGAQILIPREREPEGLESICIVICCIYGADHACIVMNFGEVVVLQLIPIDKRIQRIRLYLPAYHMLLLDAPEGQVRDDQGS